MAIKKGPGKPLDDHIDPEMAFHSAKYIVAGVIIGIIFFVFVL